jgi:hypothetical protein
LFAAAPRSHSQENELTIYEYTNLAEISAGGGGLNATARPTQGAPAVELSGMLSTIIQAISARPRYHLKERLLVIIGRTLFRQKNCCDIVLVLVEWRATYQKRPTRLMRREAPHFSVMADAKRGDFR